MRDIVQKIYKKKAKYYIDILDAFDGKGIHYLLLNFSIPDDNPGDLDVLISPEDYKHVISVLHNNSLKKYYLYNTNQELWNKYISRIGFIQIHVYIDFCFFGKKIFNFKELYSGGNRLTIEKDYIVFILETFFKNEYHKKYSKLEIYKKHINKQLFQDILDNSPKELQQIVNKSLSLFSSKITFTQKYIYTNIIKYHKLQAFGYLLKHFAKKLLKRCCFSRRDIKVVFLGIDGAGKSTIVENIKKVSSKGGIYPIKLYMGIRDSIINRLREIVSNKVVSGNGKLNFNGGDLDQKESKFRQMYSVAIGLLYWIEYNIKWMISIKYKSVNAQTLWLIDRNYYDVLIHYKQKILKTLFLKYSFKPDIVILLVGDVTTIYQRKKEYDVEHLTIQKAGYEELLNDIASYGIETSVIDSTMENAEESAFTVLGKILI